MIRPITVYIFIHIILLLFVWAYSIIAFLVLDLYSILCVPIQPLAAIRTKNHFPSYRVAKGRETHQCGSKKMAGASERSSLSRQDAQLPQRNGAMLFCLPIKWNRCSAKVTSEWTNCQHLFVERRKQSRRIK